MASPCCPVHAAAQDGSYPRPQLLRPQWFDLSGEWDFAYDDTSGDTDRRSPPAASWARTIVVPFPPESALSGIGDRGYHPVVWYRRRVTSEEIATAGHTGSGRRLLLHFGAVDFRAEVWAGGSHVGGHEGGHTPFTVDVTQAATAGGFDVVVRAEDDPHDLEQPRGKQDWESVPHVIWYHRTTGIWQPVWLESVPDQHVGHLTWRPDPSRAGAGLRVELARAPEPGTVVRIVVELEGRSIVEVTTTASGRRTDVGVPLAVLRTGQDVDRYLWSPEHPILFDARVELVGPEGVLDTAYSYFGVRSVGTGGGRFLLNERPYPVRAVLSQGYWPQSHLAAPSPEALREEVQLIKDLGFTTARLHQKVEDPRFLYWADRLGLLVWDELPSAYEYSTTTVGRLTREWLEVVRRDASHPCVAVWVPFNESWGVPRVADDERQQQLVRALYHLTKALDGTRLVVSNDGWEHTDSDLLTVHDYQNDAVRLAASYADDAAVERTVTGIGPGNRRIFVLPPEQTPDIVGAPVVVSEFGGVSSDPDPDSGTWGYRVVGSPAELHRQLRDLFRALNSSSAIAGWCYTQLTDTEQETNGLTDEKRVPKLPMADLSAMVRGD